MRPSSTCSSARIGERSTPKTRGRCACSFSTASSRSIPSTPTACLRLRASTSAGDSPPGKSSPPNKKLPSRVGREPSGRRARIFNSTTPVGQTRLHAAASGAGSSNEASPGPRASDDLPGTTNGSTQRSAEGDGLGVCGVCRGRGGVQQRSDWKARIEAFPGISCTEPEHDAAHADADDSADRRHHDAVSNGGTAKIPDFLTASISTGVAY